MKEILAESLFEPKEKSPFSIITKLENPSYCEMRAVELISEAQLSTAGGTVGQDYHDKISQAIALLALARFFRGANGSVQSKKHKEGWAGSEDQGGSGRFADA